MKSATWIRLVGAGLIIFAIFALVQQGVGIATMKAYVLERMDARSWIMDGVSALLNLAMIWVGFALPSRRPSRRRAVTIILALTALYRIYTLVNLTIFMASRFLPMPVWAPTSILDLLLLAFALAYIFRTRGDPEFLPRRDVTPIETAPPGTHRLVAAKIVDGPEWREALLASLHETGVQETQRRAVWPWVIALIFVAAVDRALSYAFDPLFGALPPTPQTLAWLVWALVSLALLALPFSAIRRRMLQARQRNAEEALRKAGAKRPIFYLRSFALDQEVGRRSILELFLNATPANPEQTLTRVLRGSGPVIAIGRPGEQLPALGAARFYVAHELWQEKVADVATVAQLVVWASGVTPGLQWEITHLVRALPPEKLVLFAHPHLIDLDADEREAQWSTFVDGLGGLFPKPLPKPLGTTRFFAFDKDFTPIPFGSSNWTLQGALGRSLRALLTAKDIAPYDKKSVARRRLIRRIVLGVVGAVFGALLLGAAYLAWLFYAPGDPSPLGWNLLGGELYPDEAYVSPPNPGETLRRLHRTADDLAPGWLRDAWQGEPPGRLPRLKLAADHYVALFEAAHADRAVEGDFYARRRGALAFEAASAEEAKALSQKLAPVRAALAVVDQDWAAVKSETTGFFYPEKIRAMVAAREQLLAADAALLDLLAANPSAWTRTADANGAATLSFSDEKVLAEVRARNDERGKAEADFNAALTSK